MSSRMNWLTISVLLFEQRFQLLVVEIVSHCAQDGPHFFHFDVARLGRVEHLEHSPKHYLEIVSFNFSKLKVLCLSIYPPPPPPPPLAASRSNLVCHMQNKREAIATRAALSNKLCRQGNVLLFYLLSICSSSSGSAWPIGNHQQPAKEREEREFVRYSSA